MNDFVKGDIVTASVKARKYGLWHKKPHNRLGTVAHVARDGKVNVLWDGNRSSSGVIHPAFLTLVTRKE